MFYHKLLLCALFVFPLKVIRTRFIYCVSVCECVYVCDWQMFCLTNVISLIQITLQMLSLSLTLCQSTCGSCSLYLALLLER